MSVEQVAELIGISKAMVRKLIAQARIPVVRIGRRVVIPVRELELKLQTGTL